MIDVSTSGHYVGDCRDLLAQLPDACVQMCVTSPPYWGLRDYGHAGQLGLETTPDEYVASIIDVFRGVRRVLRDDGTLWLNLGDSYAGATATGNPGAQGAAGVMADRSVIAARRARPGNPDKNGGVSNRNGLGAVAGLKPKDLVGIPWMVAFALRADGWWLRQDIVWSKPNPMPESVTDRCTKAHEYMFLLSKSERYYFNGEAIAEAVAHPAEAERARRSASTPDGYSDGSGRNDGNPHRSGGFPTDRKTRNKRSVWTVATEPYAGAHFACFPTKLIEPCILAGSKPSDLVLDPFFGAGTTGLVAKSWGRRYIGFDLGYHDLATKRLCQEVLPIWSTP